MSHSREERIRNIESALRLVMEELGSRAIWELLVDPDNAHYADIYSTTWEEMKNHYLLKAFPVIGHTDYGLTGYGWLKGLELLGKIEQAKVEVGKITKAIKDCMDGRNEIKFVYSDPIASAAGVSEGFLHNVIESDFISIVLRRYTVEPDLRGAARYLFTIPVNFGQEIL